MRSSDLSPETGHLRPVEWVGSSLKDMRAMPEEVKDVFGFALFAAQRGETAPGVKPLRGFGGAGVLEIVEDHDGNTFRAVYTVRFRAAIYVLHVFQKKSRSGIRTPQADIDLVRERLRAAERHYQEHYEGER